MPEESGPPSPHIYLVSSITTGVICTAVFNPYDRGLYLSIKENRPFLLRSNFSAPYQGCLQAVLQKCIFGSVYYIMQSSMQINLYPYLREELHCSELSSHLSIGLAAGGINGLVNNPMSAIKYQTWGDDRRKYTSTARDMWRDAKIRPFMKGTIPTVCREMVFGSTYEVIRNALAQKTSGDKTQPLASIAFICNTISASLATIAAGPMNYARNMQYKTLPKEKAPSILESLANMNKDAKEKHKSILAKCGFFAKRMQFGWGTARAALGMSVGQTVFEESKKAYTQYFPPNKKPKLG